MTAFSEPELAFLLGDRRLGRVATVGKDGTPHVVPVGWSYNEEHGSIDIGGRDFAESKKYRDVQRSGRAAFVVDDLAGVNPWRPRGIEVRGRAEALSGERPLIRIHPERIDIRRVAALAARQHGSVTLARSACRWAGSGSATSRAG